MRSRAGSPRRSTFELVAAEAVRRTDHPDALDYILRGRAVAAKARTANNRAEMVSLFQRALALDLRSVEAKSWLAIALTVRAFDQITGSADDITLAEGLAAQALAASPRSFLAHYATAQVLRAQGRYEEAIPEYEAAIGLNRNWVGAISSLGWCKFYAGSTEEAIPHQERAIRLSPRDGQLANWYWRIGVAHLTQSRLDEAIRWFEKARSTNPGHHLPYAFLASAHALKGDMEPAAIALADAQRLSADERYSSIAGVRANGYWGVPKIRALYEATYFVGLRKAGMPED
jgi:adenylate cyclase